MPGGIHGGVELYTGEVSVSEQVIAYQRKTVKDQEVIDLIALNLPEQSFTTRALWYVLPDELAGPEALPPEVQLGALHAAEHSQIAVLPLLAMCDRWDIGGLSTNVHFQTGRPTIFIYDGHPGGVGIAERGFERFSELVGNALRLVSECPCDRGCPSCVQSPKCGNLNEPLHKAGAIELMGGILGRASGPLRDAALMHRRFEGAPTAELRCPGGSVKAVVAKGFRLRLLGLMRIPAGEAMPLLFARCRSIHMHGMKTAIDLVWLDDRRRRGSRARRCRGAQAGPARSRPPRLADATVRGARALARRGGAARFRAWRKPWPGLSR